MSYNMISIRLLITRILVLFLLMAGGAWADKRLATATEELEGYGFVLKDLKSAFEDERVYVRQLAARVAAENRFNKRIPDLKAALNDDSHWVRVLAAGALLEMNDHSGVETLTRALESQDMDLIVEAADQLVRLKDAKALARLVELIKNSQAIGRIRAVRVVGKYFELGSTPEAISTLVEVALDGRADLTLRRVCVGVLQTLDNDSTVHSMMNKLNKDPDPVIQGVAEQFIRVRKVE